MSLRIWIRFVIVINICICFCCCSVCLSDTSYVRCAERHNAKWMWLNELTRRQTLRRRLWLRLRQRLRLRRDAAITSERETNETKQNEKPKPGQGKARQGMAKQRRSNSAAAAQSIRLQFTMGPIRIVVLHSNISEAAQSSIFLPSCYTVLILRQQCVHMGNSKSNAR